MIEEILKQIKAKKEELRTLENSLKQEGLSEYNHLVGKYYRLAATCFIHVTSLGYVGDGYVYINCIKIIGGKYDSGRLKINHTDDYEIRIAEVPHLSEITKGAFIDFLTEALKCAEETTTKLISE